MDVTDGHQPVGSESINVHNSSPVINSTSVPHNPVSGRFVPEKNDQVHVLQTGQADSSNGIALEQLHGPVDPQSEPPNPAIESSREAIRSWSLRHNITHNALKDLLGLLKDKYNDISLPTDPRTLLETPQNIGQLCYGISGGKYWHHGLAACLEKWFENVSCDICISININIDGLPIHKSSKFQLWPILCNVHEMKELPPLPIGIFLGKTKPADINEYLAPFVNEVIPLLENGYYIKGHFIKIKIRCFICDSPARAFVKSIFNYKENLFLLLIIYFMFYRCSQL